MIFDAKTGRGDERGKKSESPLGLPEGWGRLTTRKDIVIAQSLAEALIAQNDILGSNSLRKLFRGDGDSIDQAVSVMGTMVNEAFPFYKSNSDPVRNGSLGEMLQNMRKRNHAMDCRVTTVIALEVLKKLSDNNLDIRLANVVDAPSRGHSSSFPLINIHPFIMYNPAGGDFVAANLLTFKVVKPSTISEMALGFSAQYERLLTEGSFLQFEPTPSGIIEQEQAFLNGYRTLRYE